MIAGAAGDAVSVAVGAWLALSVVVEVACRRESACVGRARHAKWSMPARRFLGACAEPARQRQLDPAPPVSPNTDVPGDQHEDVIDSARRLRTPRTVLATPRRPPIARASATPVGFFLRLGRGVRPPVSL